MKLDNRTAVANVFGCWQLLEFWLSLIRNSHLSRSFNS